MKKNYEVGYGKPPKHARFRKGQSGNPKGRPGGTKNLRTDLTEELGEKITVRDGTRTMSISKQRGVVKSLVARTLNGDARAGATLFTMMLRVLKVDQDVETSTSQLSSQEVEALAAMERRLLGSLETSPPAGGTASEVQDPAEENE